MIQRLPLLLLAFPVVGIAEEGPVAPSLPQVSGLVQGKIHFRPNGSEKAIPADYRLDDHRFEFEMKLRQSLPVSGIEIHEVRFPSPLKSKHPENDLVHAEYYRPIGPGPFPCVVVLDILAGNQILPRLIGKHLATQGVGALFVQMAYYGPRRPAGERVRFLSSDVYHTARCIRQTILDLRRAAAWMESRPEIDSQRLGVMGVSLGSFLAALSAEMEPRYGRVVVLLGGGDFVDGYWDHPQAAPYLRVYEKLGGTKKLLQGLIAPIDPITHAGRLKDRDLLIIAARHDEVVPPRMAENLWNASGRQQLLWLEAGHYTAALYLLPGLTHIVDHFRRPTR